MKKILITIIAVIMFVSASGINVFAEDVKDEVSSLGIMQGYSNGDFHMDLPVTRAEMTQICLNMQIPPESRAEFAESIKSADNSQFTFDDVAENHWAYVPVTFMSRGGNIAGYGDGTFRPDNNVTYSEAITMLVNMLGYNVISDDVLKTAEEIGLTRGLGTFNPQDNAIRGDIAAMALNAFDIPMVVMWGFSATDGPEYKIDDETTLRSMREDW